MRQFSKLLSTGIAAAAMLLSALLPAQVSAEENLPVFDPAKPCSISISLTKGQKDEKPEVNAGITIYHVADFVIEDGSYSFAYTEEFSKCTYEIRNIAAAEDPTISLGLSDFVETNHIAGVTARTDAKGTVIFTDLKAGLYFVQETDTPEGFEPFTPFLTSVPVTENGVMKYDITAEPKIGEFAETELYVHKVWNDDKDSHPDVTVQILKNGKVYDTVTLTEKNHWHYSWTSLNAADDWDVKEINVPAGYTPSYSNDKTEFTVRNTPTLVQTGQVWQPVIYLCCGGLVMILLGTILVASGKKRRKHDDA